MKHIFNFEDDVLLKLYNSEIYNINELIVIGTNTYKIVRKTHYLDLKCIVYHILDLCEVNYEE